MISRKVPTTVVTGFLGAGKTSLIRHVMRHAGGRRIALIINEFGDVGVDREIVQGCQIEGCRDEDMIELANGCICCTVADDFLPTIRRLLERDEPPDHILIETSGLALPKPLVQAFNWPDVKSRATVDGVIAVIDAEATAAGMFAADPDALAAAREADPALDHESPLEELFEEQILCADLIVLNKMDRIEPAGHETAMATLNGHRRPGTPIVASRFGAVDLVVLLGLEAAAEADLECRPSHHDDGDHDHDDFESFVVDIGEVVNPVDLETAIATLARDNEIYRVKGFVHVANKPSRRVVQAVGERVQGYFDRPWQAGEDRTSRLVVIGAAGLDRRAIEDALMSTANASETV
ncbi:MAG: cobalamin biosynthesis protein CobW [Geminicoccaceae bacterium]